ncbi:hypothetical protein [Mesorhizobium sp. B2-8-9]|uniref:phage pre-tape measure protein n=1 Tax=Mesorhizobium sp. B2-8-9 TaxID=2589899 RepID=UPI00112B41A6|nr:hypothetical protein [Mesorhizobium sp. B2-8-9]TPI86362.1 hypothetical protein FJ423_00630 [Mesorhizobium sp. B2-8-9]
MALKYTPQNGRIDFGDDDFIEVRGLDVADITQLFEVNQDMVATIYDKVVGRDPKSFTQDDVTAIYAEISVAFPAVVNHVIAMAADSLDQFAIVSRLPLDVKIAALERISILTFQMSGGLGNFLEIVMRIAGRVRGLVKNIKAPLPLENGSSDSTAR